MAVDLLSNPALRGGIVFYQIGFIWEAWVEPVPGRAGSRGGTPP
jgi:hypothetical protein